jgi:hypothetical protein
MRRNPAHARHTLALRPGTWYPILARNSEAMDPEPRPGWSGWMVAPPTFG